MDQAKIDLFRIIINTPGSLGLTHEKQLELLKIIEQKNKEIEKLQPKQQSLF